LEESGLFIRNSLRAPFDALINHLNWRVFISSKCWEVPSM